MSARRSAGLTALPKHADADADAGAKEITLRLEGFAYQALCDEAARMKVPNGELARFCVLYYLADIDSGRIAHSIPGPPEQGGPPVTVGDRDLPSKDSYKPAAA